MSKVILYQLPFSAPCRSVQILCDIIGVELENRNCDLMKGEHLTPEFLKLNPHHTIPTMVDDGFVLRESRAIMQYLVTKFAPNSTLYPNDLKKRALIDQALNFDSCALYSSMGMVVYLPIKFGMKLNPEIVKMLEEKLKLLNDDLGRNKYVAGDELTIADLSILATWTSIVNLDIVDSKNLTNIHAWVDRIKKSGKIKHFEELVESTAKSYGQFVKEKLKDYFKS